MTQIQDDLMALRASAQDRNPEQTQFLLKKILLNMEFFIALMVAVERVHPFVEIFERYYPEARWARQILVQIASLGTAPGQLPPEAMRAMDGYAAPGIANFMKALSDLAHALQPGPQPQRVGYMVSAVVNAIMAELVESWYRDRNADWQRVRANQIDPITGTYTDPEATQIAYAFWTDPATASRDRALWIMVADSIAAKIKR